MTSSPELDNLVRVGALKKEPPSRSEFDGLLRSGAARLADAQRVDLSPESRFDLAYNAAHALSLAALRYRGYRSDNRYAVFQTLPHTLAIESKTWRVLATAHDKRNRTEYEGVVGVTGRLLEDLIASTNVVLKAVQQLADLREDE
jgi:hypothetical protein